MKTSIFCLTLIFITIPFFGIAQFKNESFLGKEKNKGFTISTGAEVFSIHGNSFIGTFITPEYRFNLTPKITINTGLNIGNLSANMNASDYESISYYNYISPFFSNSFFIEGIYSYSNKLTITSSYITSLPLSTSKNIEPQMNPNVNDWKSAKIGIDYKITDGVHINAQFGISNSPFNYRLNSPLNSPYKQFYFE